MGNVTLPTPVFVAGGALCVLAGYLAGSVLGSGQPDRPTAVVASYDAGSSRLCLEGDELEGMDDVGSDGTLCGTWSHGSGWVKPRPGDRFRFVSLDRRIAKGSDESGVVIFGTVVE
ncbi:MAG TPA: hypothetical protein VFK34_04835 [Marmoricola sp.]|nr:hypothetical protein [Marmoricola sp.]